MLMIEETIIQEPASIADAFRNLGVGEVLELPLAKYNYCSMMRSQRLKPERFAGMNWTVQADIDRGVTLVTRTS